MNDILVSICCQTFNHKDYITQALDSFLIQKTNFKYEILLRDDASTDGTTKVCERYYQEYPDLIKLLTYKENQYQKGVRPMADNLKRAKGKYIAICEGDDYWIDPLKLQKQVDFLEANEGYGLVHGDCDFFFQVNQKWLRKANETEKLSNNMIIDTKEELFRRLTDANYKIRTATVLFRKSLLDESQANSVTFKMGDTPMWLDFSQITKFKYFDEVFSVYRINPGSVSNPLKRSEKTMFSLSSWEMRIYYHKKMGYEIPTSVKLKYNEVLANCLIFNSQHKNLYPFFKDVHYNRLVCYDYKLIRILLKAEYFWKVLINKFNKTFKFI